MHPSNFLFLVSLFTPSLAQSSPSTPGFECNSQGFDSSILGYYAIKQGPSTVSPDKYYSGTISGAVQITGACEMELGPFSLEVYSGILHGYPFPGCGMTITGTFTNGTAVKKFHEAVNFRYASSDEIRINDRAIYVNEQGIKMKWVPVGGTISPVYGNFKDIQKIQFKCYYCDRMQLACYRWLMAEAELSSANKIKGPDASVTAPESSNKATPQGSNKSGSHKNAPFIGVLSAVLLGLIM